MVPVSHEAHSQFSRPIVFSQANTSPHDFVILPQELLRLSTTNFAVPRISQYHEFGSATNLATQGQMYRHTKYSHPMRRQTTHKTGKTGPHQKSCLFHAFLDQNCRSLSQTCEQKRKPKRATHRSERRHPPKQTGAGKVPPTETASVTGPRKYGSPHQKGAIRRNKTRRCR